MAESLSINVGGTWKTITNCEINVGGTWKTPTAISINVGGTWKQVWPPAGGSVVINGGTSSHFVSGGACFAGITFGPDGQCYDLGSALAGRTIITSGEWWSDEPDTGIGSSYDVRQASLTSGAWNVQAATVGTWIQISVERIWRCNVTAMSAPNTSAAAGSFEIRATGSGSALDTATYSADASN